jgi:hypothetical protein
MSWAAGGKDALFVLYTLVTFLLAGTGLYYGLIAVERVVRTRSAGSPARRRGPTGSDRR